METAIRIVISILTFFTFISCIYITYLGLHLGVVILCVTGAALTFAFGLFVYHDIQYWLNQAHDK